MMPAPEAPPADGKFYEKPPAFVQRQGE